MTLGYNRARKTTGQTRERKVFDMAVGKRIYLKRHMPDPEVMMQFKTIPALSLIHISISLWMCAMR